MGHKATKTRRNSNYPTIRNFSRLTALICFPKAFTDEAVTTTCWLKWWNGPLMFSDNYKQQPNLNMCKRRPFRHNSCQMAYYSYWLLLSQYAAHWDLVASLCVNYLTVWSATVKAIIAFDYYYMSFGLGEIHVTTSAEWQFTCRNVFPTLFISLLAAVTENIT